MLPTGTENNAKSAMSGFHSATCKRYFTVWGDNIPELGSGRVNTLAIILFYLFYLIWRSYI